MKIRRIRCTTCYRRCCDPDTGEKLSWWERTGAGVMVFAGKSFIIL
ncbi:pre-toxin TG domain-containing protein [Bacillus paranthracis]